jgi:HPt (histidine-containing phosphotransfer) domain-containing protein
MIKSLLSLFGAGKKKEQTDASQKADANKEPVIDYEVVTQLKELSGADFIYSLYQDYEQEAKVLIKEISDCAAAGKVQECLSPLHQLKGTSGTLGLKVLYSHIRAMEQELKEGRSGALAQHVKLLQQYFQEYQSSYRKELHHLKI